MQERFVFTETDYLPTLDMLRDGRFYHGDVDSPAVARLLERCRAVVRPRAVAACVEVKHDEEGHVTAVGGEAMSSVVLDGQLGKLHRAFAYVATCGPEIAEVDYEGDDELRRALLAFCIGGLNAVTAKMTAALTERYRGAESRQPAGVAPGGAGQGVPPPGGRDGGHRCGAGGESFHAAPGQLLRPPVRDRAGLSELQLLHQSQMRHPPGALRPGEGGASARGMTPPGRRYLIGYIRNHRFRCRIDGKKDPLPLVEY